MKILTVDVENTMYKHQKRGEDGLYNPKDRIGSAFCKPQFLVMVGIKWLDNKEGETLQWQVSETFYSSNKKYIERRLKQADLVVGFNIKHDLHWLKRVGIDNAYDLPVWDCQVAEFMLEAQKNPYPSLNKTCEKYNIPLKLDVVATEYWDNGYDTDEVPTEVCSEYLLGDLDRTERVFLKQCEQFNFNIK